MLISTLEALFGSEKSLFEGLAIYDYWDWSASNPVVRLSFSVNYTKPGQVESDSRSQIRDLEREYGLDSSLAELEDGPARLRSLLKNLHRKTGQQVVVLVDEYDAPILDAIEDPELAKQNRDFLRGFYKVIKDSYKHVRFVFVTGISMFSNVSLFSGLNNLHDISLDPEFATICGYTEDDLDTVFTPELEGLDRNEIREWYNGYNWLGKEKVYNPYDLLSLFRLRRYEAHWFTTGAPTFLYQVMKQRGFTPLDVENLTVQRDFVSTFEVDDISAEALMFQAGYLTITSEERIGSRTQFTLDYPNMEVREHLNEGFLMHVSQEPGQVSVQRLEMCEKLIANDFGGFAEKLRAIFHKIPHQWYDSSDVARYEAWYAAILFTCFRAQSFKVSAEESSSHGRSDLVVEHGEQAFVFELKVTDSEDGQEQVASDAIKQIRSRGYAEAYRGTAEVIHLVGIAFSREKRNLAAVKVEQIEQGHSGQ